MYPNLIIEAKRRNITQLKISEICGIKRDTVHKKMDKDGRFTIDEAIKIKCNLFPDCTLEHLFERK